MMATQEMVTRRSEPVLDLAPLRGMQRAGALFADLREGFRLFPLACALGWLDVKMRYRGSMLGPFWLTISTAVMVGSLSLLYSRLFHMDLARYLPYLSLSLILWGYISSLLSEGATVFTSAQGLIHATRMPYSVHVLRAIVRNVLVLLHNVAVPLVVALIFHVWPRAVWQEIPALAIWGVDSLLVCLAMGVLGARFRDIPPIVGSVVQVFFFITPIIWRPELIHHAGYLLLNPFYPLLAIVREPLLGEQVGEGIWLAALAHSAALLVLGAVVFSRFRSRLAYWI